MAPAANASRMWSAPSIPPATWSGTATRRGDRAHRLEIRRAARARAVEVDEVDQRRAQLHEPLGDPFRPVGRACRRPVDGAGPVDEPRAAACDVDRRDDLHAGSARPVLPRLAARSSRRWKLIGSEPLRSSVSWKALSEKPSPSAALLVVAQPQEQDLAQQVAELVRRRVGVAVDLGLGVGVLEAGVLDQEVDRLVDR